MNKFYFFIVLLLICPFVISEDTNECVNPDMFQRDISSLNSRLDTVLDRTINNTSKINQTQQTTEVIVKQQSQMLESDRETREHIERVKESVEQDAEFIHNFLIQTKKDILSGTFYVSVFLLSAVIVITYTMKRKEVY